MGLYQTNLPPLRELIRPGHPRLLPLYTPQKYQLYPHKRTYIYYGSSVQYAAEDDSIPPLYSLGMNGSKALFLPYYIIHGPLTVSFFSLCTIDPTNLLPLKAPQLPSPSYSTTSPRTQMTALPTAPVAWSSQVTLTLPSLTKASLTANQGLSEEVLIPVNNGPLLTLAQIIKFGMSSESESELAPLFITVKQINPSTKPSSKWAGPSYGHLSKQTTWLTLRSGTIPSPQNPPNPWTCASAESAARISRTKPVTIGLPELQIFLITAPNIITHCNKTKIAPHMCDEKPEVPSTSNRVYFKLLSPWKTTLVSEVLNWLQGCVGPRIYT